MTVVELGRDYLTAINVNWSPQYPTLNPRFYYCTGNGTTNGAIFDLDIVTTPDETVNPIIISNNAAIQMPSNEYNVIGVDNNGNYRVYCGSDTSMVINGYLNPASVYLTFYDSLTDSVITAYAPLDFELPALGANASISCQPLDFFPLDNDGSFSDYLVFLLTINAPANKPFIGNALNICLVSIGESTLTASFEGLLGVMPMMTSNGGIVMQQSDFITKNNLVISLNMPTPFPSTNPITPPNSIGNLSFNYNHNALVFNSPQTSTPSGSGVLFFSCQYANNDGCQLTGIPGVTGSVAPYLQYNNNQYEIWLEPSDYLLSTPQETYSGVFFYKEKIYVLIWDLSRSNNLAMYSTHYFNSEKNRTPLILNNYTKGVKIK